MQPHVLKLAALRAKTDRELLVILTKEVERALRIVERSPDEARTAHDRTRALMAGVRNVCASERDVLERKLAMLAVRLGVRGGRWFAVGCGGGRGYPSSAA